MPAPDAPRTARPVVLVRSVGGGDALRLCAELGLHPSVATIAQPGAGDAAGRNLTAVDRALRELRDLQVGGQGLTDEALRTEAVVRAREVSTAAAVEAIESLAAAVAVLGDVPTIVEPSLLPLPVLRRLLAACPSVGLVLLVGDPLPGVAKLLAEDATALGPTRWRTLADAVAAVEGAGRLVDAQWRRTDGDEGLLAVRVAAAADAAPDLATILRHSIDLAVPEARHTFVELVAPDAVPRFEADADAEVDRAAHQWRAEVEDAVALAGAAGDGQVLVVSHEGWRTDPDATWAALVAAAQADERPRPATAPAPPAARASVLPTDAAARVVAAVAPAATLVGLTPSAVDATDASASSPEATHGAADVPTAATGGRHDEVVVYQPLARWSMTFTHAWTEIGRSAGAHRNLIWQLFKRDFLTPYRTSYLGLSWLLIAPLLGVVQWIVVRGNGVLDAGDVGVPYPVYVLLGTTMWGLFLGLYQAAADTLRSSGGLLQQVRFPRETLIFKQMGQQVATFFAGLLVSVGVLAVYGIVPRWEALALPVVIVPVTLMATAIGLLVAMVIVVAADLDRVLRLMWALVMWLSPVVYTLDQKSGLLVDIARWNPLTYLVLAPRSLILEGTLGDPVAFAASSALALGLFLVAGRLFYVSEPQLVERLL